jgi:hypothetical protein
MKRNMKTIYVPDHVDLPSLVHKAAQQLAEKGYRVSSYMKRSEQSDSAVILSALMYAAGLNPDDPLREENQKD